MSLIEESFKEIFPSLEFDFDAGIKYSGHFNGYNANIRLDKFRKKLIINMSKQWRGVDREIKKGLIQELLCKMFKKKANTRSIDLYNIFIKQVHLAVPKTESHPVLETSFGRINDGYFYGMIDQPNLVLGEGLRTLGHYNYGTDTITITKHLIDYPDLLDYVMYHEVLHKKQQFTSKNGRHYHHTVEFRKKEKEFPNSEEMEKRLSGIIGKKKIKSAFRRILFLD